MNWKRPFDVSNTRTGILNFHLCTLIPTHVSVLSLILGPEGATFEVWNIYVSGNWGGIDGIIDRIWRLWGINAAFLTVHKNGGLGTSEQSKTARAPILHQRLLYSLWTILSSITVKFDWSKPNEYGFHWTYTSLNMRVNLERTIRIRCLKGMV